MSADLTAAIAPLAAGASRIARLLTARSVQPALSAVLVRADRERLLLSATDGEASAQVEIPAIVHDTGEVAVSRKALAETLAALDSDGDVRLSVEGSRLAVRTPSARFALPCLDSVALPAPASGPSALGTVSGASLRAAAIPVASAASREHALPFFTGVRLRSAGGQLSLVATDRYRMAQATIPWSGEAVDGLVPAAFLAEAARQVAGAGEVEVLGDRDRFGLAWAGGSVVTACLGTPFPDQQIDQLLAISPECSIEVEADALSAAVDRAAPYAGPHARVVLQASDGRLVVRGSDTLAGESEETIKASVQGDHVERGYHARFLLDALRPFAGHTVLLRVQPGMRATALTAAPIPLHHLVVPMRLPEAA